MKKNPKINIDNALYKYGYHLKYVGIDDNTNEIVFNLYLDNGQGMGKYRIPYNPAVGGIRKNGELSENQNNIVDFILYIREQFQILHPELFK